MRSKIRRAVHVPRASAGWVLALVAVSSSCSSSTQPAADWASITLISGADQTVKVNPSGLTDLPQLVVVRVDSLGTPMAGGELRVNVHMNGAPGSNGPYSFFAGPDGVAAMQLQLSNIVGPVDVKVWLVKCTSWGFVLCERSVTLASVSVPGIVAQ
jgi:hypothetical protein